MSVKPRDMTDALTRGLIEASPDALIIVDSSARIVMFNPAAEKMFGWPRAELLGRTIETLIPERHRESHQQHRARYMEKKNPSARPPGRILEARHRDGTVFSADISLSPIKTKDGTFVGVIVRDVSENVRAVAALQKSEAAFRELIEQASDAVFVADLEGRYTHVNTAACRMLGYTHDELVGKTIVDLILPEDIPRLEAQKQFFLLGPDHVDVSNWLLRTKDGRRIPVEVSAKIHADGRWVAFVRDISERLRAEEALRRSEESLAEAQRVAHMGSWEWDLRTNQVRRSDELFRLFGLEPHGISPERNSIISYVHDEDRERVQATVDQAARDGRSYTIEHRIVREDGVERIVWQQGTAVLENESPVRMVGTLFDVTERRRAELELERLRAEWSSVVAHDLRQPINTIGLYAQLLTRSTDPDDLKESATRIREASRRLNRMIEDIMDLSRLEAHRMSLKPQSIEVVPIVQALTQQLALDSPERVFEVRIAGEIPLVNADPDRFAQIMDNLLTNALKYGDDGPIVVAIEGQRDGVRVSVTNTGKGIAPDAIPLLFQRFSRTGDARKSKIKGTGLGLYIVRELVEAHGGSIDVESTPGATTTFRFTLPRAN